MTKDQAIEALIAHAKRCPEPEPRAHGYPEDIRDDYNEWRERRAKVAEAVAVPVVEPLPPDVCGTTEGIVSVRDDFIAFCEAVSERPLTTQQRLLAEVLSEQQKGMFSRALGQQRDKAFIQGLHARFMQGRRADLLIVDDVASSAEAAKLLSENDHVKRS